MKRKKSVIGWVYPNYFDMATWSIKSIYHGEQFLFQCVYKYKKHFIDINTLKPIKVRITIEEI